MSTKHSDVSFYDGYFILLILFFVSKKKHIHSITYASFSLCSSNCYKTYEFVQVERRLNECSSSLKWNKERVKELEMKLTSMQQVGFVLVVLFELLFHAISFVSTTSWIFLYVTYEGVVLIKRCCCSQ